MAMLGLPVVDVTVFQHTSKALPARTAQLAYQMS